MNKAKFLSSMLKGLTKHGPKIAAGIGGALLVAGGYLLGREVPKYQEELKKKKEETEGELPKKEKAKIFVKHFAAPVLTIAGGASTLAAAVFVSERRIARLMPAAVLSEAATSELSNYKAATKEIVGEEKVEEIEKKANDIRTDKFLASADLPSGLPEHGKFWCKDTLFGGAWFQTDVATLEAAENELSRRLIVECDERATVTINDAYELIGHELIGAGDKIVCRYNDKKRGYKMVDLGISSTIINGMPVITITPKFEVIFEDSNGNVHFCEL